MSISGIGAGLDALATLFAPRQISSTSAADFFAPDDQGTVQEVDKIKKGPEQDFLDYAKMSDAEKLRLQELKEKDVTQEKLNEMDAQQREAIEEGIRQKVEEMVRQQTGKSAGGIANLLV